MRRSAISAFSSPAGSRKKEHNEFSSNIDLIDMLPPGLYEAKFERKSGDTASPDLMSGEWVMRCEQRTLDDIRAMGGNSPEDERRFATAARVSEINLSLYRAFMQPMVKAIFTPQVAEAMKRFDTGRLQYEAFTDANPLMPGLAKAAEQVRENRKPVASDNPFLAAQEKVSDQIVKSLDAWRETPGEALREDVPRHLRIAGAAGRRRSRSGGRPAAKAGKISDAPRTRWRSASRS